MRLVFTYICQVKKLSILFFLLGLFSVSLASGSYAKTISESTLSSIQEKSLTLQAPTNWTAIVIEEVVGFKTFEQTFNPGTFLFFEKKSASKRIAFLDPFSKNKDNFFFKNNQKKLLSQQIYPFHFYW